MRMLRYLMDYLDKEYDITQIEDVKPFHIKHFLLLKQEEGKKPQYINDLLKVYKTFFRYLEEEDYLNKAPTAKIHNVKQPKVLIRTFSEDEIRRMLNYCNGRDFVSIRNKALLSILFDTGMRLNEVVSLKREQIHEEYILVHGKGNKERLVPVSPFLGKALMRYLVVRDSYFDERKIPEPYVVIWICWKSDSTLARKSQRLWVSPTYKISTSQRRSSDTWIIVSMLTPVTAFVNRHEKFFFERRYFRFSW